MGARVRKVESGGWMVAVVVGELEEFEVRERAREGLDILMFVCFGCLWRESCGERAGCGWMVMFV